MNNTQTFSFGIYVNGSLTKGFLIEKDWDEIEGYMAQVKAEHPGAIVDCSEYNPHEWESVAGEPDFQD